MVHAARTRPARILLAAALVGLAACHGAPGSGDDGDEDLGGSESSSDGSGGRDPDPIEEGSTGEPEAPDACADACLDRQSQEGIATCHACRCKVAFDDWLPPVEELQCSNAEPIVTYSASLSDTGYELEPAHLSVTSCANPSLLTSSCRQGSRLGHLTHGDVSVYWICRDPYLDVDGSVLYEDMAVVGSNTRTGATCFWDDVNHVMHDDDAPPLDLLEAEASERARSIELFSYTDGSGCITCHDHDPFIYTPYLQSTAWQSVAQDKGPYHLVTLGGEPRSTGVVHLVSAPAAPCTSCHRLGSKETCSYFVPDALASHKITAYESQVHAAASPGSPYWTLAYWMPSPTGALADFAQWEAIYGEAREHVLRCCETPGASTNGCEWAPVPMH